MSFRHAVPRRHYQWALVLTRSFLSQYDVKGYPTIKYWLDGEMKDYQQGRTYDDMKKFVTDSLEKKCSVADGEVTVMWMVEDSCFGGK